jgi:hypothetical protein
MHKLPLRKLGAVVDKEFAAPDWVKDGEELKPMSLKQKRYFLAVLAVVIPFCIWAGWFEWQRAHDGHWRAWVYTFEWPFFAGVGIYMYRRFARGELIKIPKPDLQELEKLDREDENRS